MPSFTFSVQQVSKVEYLRSDNRITVADLPNGDSLLITDVPANAATAIMLAKASTLGSDALIQVYAEVTEPSLGEGDDFYTARYDGRLELRA